MKKNPDRKTISINESIFDELHRIADVTGVKFYVLCDSAMARALDVLHHEGKPILSVNNPLYKDNENE